MRLVEGADRGRGGLLLQAALLAAATFAGVLAVRSVDVFWHLASGRWMLERGQLPRHDPFRFTSGGAPWLDHEWLFQVALAGLEAAGGVSALVAGRALAMAALAAVLLVALRRAGTTPEAAVLLLVPALAAVRVRFLLRPELVTFLALALLLALLGELRRRGGGWRLGAAAAALVALWANAHPGVLVAAPVAAAFLLGCRLPGGHGAPARGEAPLAWRWVVGVPALLLVATLANPWGAHLLSVPLRISRALSGLAAVNPDWSPFWRDPRPGPVVALAAVAALVAVAWRRGLRPDPATGLAALVLVPLAVAGVRHLPLVAIAGCLFAGETVAALERSTSGAPGRRRIPWRALAWAACGALVLLALAPPRWGPLRPPRGAPAFGAGIASGLFPARPVDVLAAWPEVGHLYNDVPFGGYLLWRLFPPRQVFLDSRNELGPELLAEVEAARRDSRRWRALLERWAIDGALVRFDERPRPVLDPAGRVVGVETAARLLFPTEEFALLAWDDAAMLFVRRTPERAARLAREELRHLHPEDWRASFAAAAADPAYRQGLLAELDRQLAADPASRRARAFAALAEGLPGGPAAPP